MVNSLNVPLDENYTNGGLLPMGMALAGLVRKIRRKFEGFQMQRTNVVPAGKEQLFREIGFCEAVRVGNLIHTAGQVGWTSYGAEFSPDLESQTRQAFKNLEMVLKNAGAAPKDIVHLMFFMVDDSAGQRTLWDDLLIVFKVKHEMFPEIMPCGTGVRVTELVKPGLLIEVQAVACAEETI